MTRFAALDIDDGTEAARERASTAGIEASERGRVALDKLQRQKGDRLAVEGRQIVHEVVDRLEPIVRRRLQQLAEPLFCFTGEQRYPQRDSLLKLRSELRQHRQASAHVETTDGDLNSRLAKLTPNVERSSKLVGLDTS